MFNFSSSSEPERERLPAYGSTSRSTTHTGTTSRMYQMFGEEEEENQTAHQTYHDDDRMPAVDLDISRVTAAKKAARRLKLKQSRRRQRQTQNYSNHYNSRPAVLTQLYKQTRSPEENTPAEQLEPLIDSELDLLQARQQQQQQQQQQHHAHSFLYIMLNPKSKQWQAVAFQNCMTAVILIDMVVFVVSTEPALAGHSFFYVAEGVASSLFLVEYMCRLWTVMEHSKYRNSYHRSPIRATLNFMCTRSMILDALATFPFFIELLVPLLSHMIRLIIPLRIQHHRLLAVFHNNAFNLPRLTYLRCFRLLRILKTKSFSRAMDSLNRVIYYNREILYVALILGFFLVIVTAILMYYLRPRLNNDDNDNDNDNQYDDEGPFRSIGATMYLSTLMLTGQGGPDAENLPWYTRSVILLTGVFSIGMFAIPASMLTWGFEAEAQRVAAESRRKARSVRLGFGGNCTSSSSSSSGGGEDNHHENGEESSVSTSDEEYLKIIAGDDEEDDAILASQQNEETRATVETLLKAYAHADVDHSGGLSKREFVQLTTQLQTTLLSSPTTNTATTTTGGATIAVADLVSRMERLESKLDATQTSLDEIQKLLKHKYKQ